MFFRQNFIKEVLNLERFKTSSSFIIFLLFSTLLVVIVAAILSISFFIVIAALVNFFFEAKLVLLLIFLVSSLFYPTITNFKVFIIILVLLFIGVKDSPNNIFTKAINSL